MNFVDYNKYSEKFTKENMFDISPFLKDDGSLNLSKLTKSKEGKSFLEHAIQKYGDARPAQLAYRVLHSIDILPNCQGCNNQLTKDNFIDFKRGYRQYCSNSCSSKNSGATDKLIAMLHTSEFKENRKQKIKERYGTESMICINRDKAAETAKRLYGVDHPLKSQYAKDQKVAFFLKKYGVDNPWKDPTVAQKCKLTLKERYGVDSPLMLVDWSKIPMTRQHREIKEFIDSVSPGLDIKINDRSLISPYEIDILIPELKLAIEFDGFYWHSEAAGKNGNYHLMKTELAEKQGYRLIHVFDDEWAIKQDIVKSRLSGILKKNKRIYARNTTIVTIPYESSQKFLEENHIQGKCRSRVRYGLEIDGEVIALMTFGQPRFNKNYSWELLRYCSVKNANVVGGASKLLSHFLKQHSGNIISYADRRWSDGHLYKILGFQMKAPSKPSYFYINPQTLVRFNRVLAQKHKLGEMFGDLFDPNLTEAENMKRAGYDRIFDCGNHVFVCERE